MIKYNNSNINDWYFADDNIIKVYRNNAVCYYKITTSGGTSGQTPCFAVVNNISQYSDTEFEDVFNKADGKWYKLNNLSQYEEYGVYGSGRSITYYEGKLTIDGSYEYIYSGSSWANVGEVSGSTASLPNVAFSVNYNAKNYDSNTKTLAKTSGQLVDVDAVITAGTPTVNDGYLTIASSTRATIEGYQTYFNRTNSAPNLTIISKQRTDGSNCHMFANRDSSYNWMYRCYSDKLTLHGSGEQGGVAVTTQPVIESVRVDSNRTATYNNYTNSTTSAYTSFSYGSTNSGKFAIFAGYGTSSGEWFVGDFYWVYMSQNTLTDDQVQQVIAYNEGGGGQPTYPMYYDEKSDPPDNLTFSSMTEAEEYECPWVGMTADIVDTDYIFDENYDWVTKYQWVTVSGEYVCVGTDKYSKIEKQQRNVDDTWTNLGVYSAGTLIESASTDCQSYIELSYIQLSDTSSRGGVQLLNTPKEGLLIEIDFQLSGSSASGDMLIIGQKDDKETVSYQMGFMQNGSWTGGYYDYGGGRLSISSTPTFTTRRTWKIGRISGSTSPSVVGCYCEGTAKTTTKATLMFDANRPYILGSIKYNGSSVPQIASWNIKPMKVYSVKIYEDYGTTLVGDYIPVVASDGVTITLYDKVSGGYANPFGTVVAGPTV